MGHFHFSGQNCAISDGYIKNYMPSHSRLIVLGAITLYIQAILLFHIPTLPELLSIFMSTN